ncbi:MAG: SprT family zinc-dependent metalloprotease [Plesiomonas sp.]|uniref:SprT family zinc-dependent metalloprotease n=1 Tax=Plesiomonas sp. TaxID=2486279 RepID=UPI003F3E110C
MTACASAIPIALQEYALQRLQNCIAQAQQRLNCPIFMPTINYCQRGMTAGSAHLQRWEIRLNPVLLLENGQVFLDEVIPHEVAHLLVHLYFVQRNTRQESLFLPPQCYNKVAPHGQEWRWMMQTILEQPAKRTHNFNVSSLRKATFPYQCACQAHMLTVRRHNRILRQQAQYRCVHCGEILTPRI